MSRALRSKDILKKIKEKYRLSAIEKVQLFLKKFPLLFWHEIRNIFRQARNYLQIEISRVISVQIIFQ